MGWIPDMILQNISSPVGWFAVDFSFGSLVQLVGKRCVSPCLPCTLLVEHSRTLKTIFLIETSDDRNKTMGVASRLLGWAYVRLHYVERCVGPFGGFDGPMLGHCFVPKRFVGI